MKERVEYVSCLFVFYSVYCGTKLTFSAGSVQFGYTE